MKRSTSVNICFPKLKIESVNKSKQAGGEDLKAEQGMSRRSLESSEQGRREGKRGLQKGGASVTLGVI